MNLKNEKVISTTVRMSNADEADRRFTIKGEVEVREGRFAMLRSGNVRALPDGNGYEEHVADFFVNNGNTLSMTVQKLALSGAQLKEIMVDVADFIIGAENSAETAVE